MKTEKFKFLTKKDYANLIHINKWTDIDFENWKNGNTEKIKKFDTADYKILDKLINLGCLIPAGEKTINNKKCNIFIINSNNLSIYS